MRKMLLPFLFVSIMLGNPNLCNAHFSAEQYDLAQHQLEEITPKLTGYINTLEYIATDLENLASQIQDESQVCTIWVVLEIVEHQSIRAWYNRLLLQNVSSMREAVNLGQMATILQFSKEPLSNGIHRLNRIYSQTVAHEHLKLYENARETMYSLITVYDQAIAAIRAAISAGNKPPAKMPEQ
jgi:hypothetical protein